MKAIHLTVAILVATVITFSGHSVCAHPEAPAHAPTKTKKTKHKWNAKDHFFTRVAEIRHEVDNLRTTKTDTMVMLGDSITEHWFRKGYMPKTIDGLLVVNEGISGDQIDRPTSSTGVTYRIDLVRKARPKIVFIMIGINDFWGGKENPAEVIPQYDKMFTRLQRSYPKTHYVLQSVLPTTRDKAYMNPEVVELNKHIKKLADESKATYLDLHSLMVNDKGEMKADYTIDGVHLSEAAYKVWLKELKKTVQEVLKK